MTIKILAIGKTDQKEIISLSDNYFRRLKHYARVEFDIIPDLKNRKSMSEDQQKMEEGRLIKNMLKENDFVILLDERGKSLSSVGFAKFLQKKMNSGRKRVVFIIGGPYGFSQEIYDRSNDLLSLSKMTFSHQMVRLFFVEQLYRAFTIIRGESYHHQ